MNALCHNPECGAFLDRPPVPYYDRETKAVVLLCAECAESFESTRDDRYERLDPKPTKEVA